MNLYLHGYSTYYAGKLSYHYSGVVMIICDLFCLHLVYNDPYERFSVMEVKYFEVSIWLVGIYAPNNANQRITKYKFDQMFYLKSCIPRLQIVKAKDM